MKGIFINILIGIISNFIVLLILYGYAKLCAKKSLQNFLFEFLGIASINSACKNAVGKLLIRKEKYLFLNYSTVAAELWARSKISPLRPALF